MKKSIHRLFFVLVGCILVPIVALATEEGNTIGYGTAAMEAAIDEINYQKSSEKVEKLQQRLSELEKTQIVGSEEKENFKNEEIEGLDISNEFSGVSMSSNNLNLIEEIEDTKKNIEEAQVENSLNEIRAKSSMDEAVRKNREADYQSYRINCNIAVKDAYLIYLNTAISELEIKLNAEEAKLSKGYTTGIETESIDAQLVSLNAQCYTAERQKELLLDNLNDNGGSYEEFSISTDLPSLDQNYYEEFLAVSNKKKEYESQISVYKDYLQSEHDDNDRVTLQMQLAQLQLADYESQLRVYVKEMMINYETKKNESDAKQKEIDVQNKKIDAIQKLLDKGKVTKTDVAAESTNLEKLKYEQIQLAGQASIARCILDNQIEGQSLQ